MSYQSISVKEAVENINANNNGWFLPAIQRPYVWGNRYESEKYICKLFDSILRSYPIGGLIIWNTSEEIAYREFIDDYKDGKIPHLLDEGLWSRKDKGLVYDGQQRLQTLYSCLKYTFNDKILVFDLLYDPKDADDLDETGFSFVESNSNIDQNQIKMNKVFVNFPNTDAKIDFRNNIFNVKEWNDVERRIIEKNIDLLWDVFVGRDKKSLAYFPINTLNESEVNEIFQRLNSGGVQLSQSDLLLSLIKETNYNFEEQLQFASKEIYNSTGKGYIFDAYNILQLLHLLVKGKVRVDTKLVKKIEYPFFIKTWDEVEQPLKDFFTTFVWEQFHINNSAIVPRKLSLLPLVVYMYKLHQKGINFKNINERNLTLMKQYFIKSQINDWNLQSYIDNFTKIIVDESNHSGNQFEFPLQEIEKYVKQKNYKRHIDLFEKIFEDYKWFALKILTPNKIYQFEPDIKRRFNPELDHIFPINLKDGTEEYKKVVDVLWNLQPIRGEINNNKSNHHPANFFKDILKDNNGDNVLGSKYFSEYDFVPDKNSELWSDHLKFIEYRKQEMKKFMTEKYGLSLIESMGNDE